MPQKDSVYGMASESFPIYYENGFDPCGHVYICEGGLVIKYEGSLIRAPFDYVRKLEQVSELPLGKVSVILKVFDAAGGEHDMAVGMSDMHLSKLRKICPKAKPGP